MHPKVSIIVTTYLEKTKPYLDICLESINNLAYNGPIETILVAPQHFCPSYNNVRTVVPPEKEYHNPHGINVGFAAASPDSTYCLYLNDDVCLTRKSLTNLVESAGDNLGLFNATCHDGQGTHWLGVPKPTLWQLQSKEFKQSLMDMDSPYPAGIFRVPYLCMFATLIPRKAWEVIGDWDEKFLTGADDVDYSYRAIQKGIGLYQTLDSLVYHGGGKTADITMDSPKRKATAKYFYEKWGQMPPGLPKEFLEAT